MRTSALSSIKPCLKSIIQRQTQTPCSKAHHANISPPQPPLQLHGIIVIVEVDVPRSCAVHTHKLIIALGPFPLGVARQHALDAHAHALHILHRRPALCAQEIQTYIAVRVDVRVDGYGPRLRLLEDHFWRFYTALAPAKIIGSRAASKNGRGPWS